MDATREHGESLAEKADFFHEVIAAWLSLPTITVASGMWSDGAISELVPGGRARLLPSRYEGRFAGIRELRLDGDAHHLHIDLGRVHQVCYTVAASVCLAFKPALEVRLLTLSPGGAPTDRWAVALMPSLPYAGEELDPDCVRHFFRRARADAQRAPQLVDLRIEPEVRASATGERLLGLLCEVVDSPGADWEQALTLLLPTRASPRTEAEECAPRCLALLEQALALREASLVIYRERTLVEFQTGKIDGVHRHVEDGHVSWQIGGLRDHHCHLALGAVSRVLFSAEPVSCQGGRLNYTLWFLTDGPAGNPWRRDGYFSIVLNAPYRGTAPRLDVIEPMLELYRRYAAEPWVAADGPFLTAVHSGVDAGGASVDTVIAPA